MVEHSKSMSTARNIDILKIPRYSLVNGRFFTVQMDHPVKFPGNINEFTFPMTGVSVQRGPEKDGMKGLDTATVTFKDVRVPTSNVLGGSVGKGSTMLAECSLRQALKT